MKRSVSILTLLGSLFLTLISVQAQQQTDPGIKSISEAVLRDHIFFLASDYMNGRVATSPEYNIASHYVASQFAAARLEPLVTKDGATNEYFQGLPFARTTYNDQPELILKQNGRETRLVHNQDYKVYIGSPHDFDTLQLVFVGYGINEPAENWNELKDLDLKGKIVVCLNGAPTKDGQPVLSAAATKKYSGRRGLSSRAFFGSMVYGKGVAGIIIVNPEGTLEMTLDELQSKFTGEKFSYLGAGKPKPDRKRPFVYVAKPGFLDLVLPGNKSNKPQILDGTYLSNHIRIIKEDTIYSNNVIGMVPGTDSLLRDEYIIVGGHLDHIGYGGNEAYNGADDNASGAAGVMEIARAVAKNPFMRTVVFAAWTSEEMGLYGSEYFLNSGIIPKEKIVFNLNLDMIGRTTNENEASHAHYVVTDKKYLKEITAFIKETNKGVTDFPLIFNNDDNSPGGSDHMSFIEAGIPAFFFFSGRHNDLHTIGDDPEKIDYPKAASICRLGYLVTERLGNMKVIPTFKPPVDPTIKNLSAEPIWAINSKANWSMVNNSIALYSTTERTVGTDTNHSVLHAVDLSNGKELWNNKLNSIFSYYYPPVIEKNIIYFHTYILKKPEGSYFGIDLNSGQIVFEYVINNSNQLRVHNNILFVKEKELIALDIATKDVIWKFGTKSSSVTDYDIDQENVYIEFTGPSGPNKDETGQNLCALKIRSGEKLWEYQIDRAYTNPRVYGNLVCFWGRDHLYG
ncbi:MAG: M20/M25/M40 family metallo-hydrolase, partial [Bacteroidetes bacterium]|nr:M20/M25/M40 family metallo-hydrolase [Bacteroidota bacterium]